jgi:hypothetical protein
MRLVERQLSTIDESHKSTKPFNPSTPPSEIFAGMNSCVLQPETTEGPFCEPTPFPCMLLFALTDGNLQMSAVNQSGAESMTENQVFRCTWISKSWTLIPASL